jgi:hypothetical protein
MLVFGLSIAVYLWSAPRTVGLDDDGYFILAAWFNGVAHPPGYPLYTLLAHAATWLPIGSPAFRVHAASALFGALACLCLWLFARRVLTEACAVAAALAYAFSPVFWSQSIVGEVYSLNAFFCFGLIALAAAPLPERPASRTAGAMVLAFAFGLSLSNHWPLMGLSVPALAVLLWPRRREFLRRLPAVAACFVFGLAPYLWMAYRSSESQIAFWGPIDSLRDFWFYVSREAYRDVDVSATAGWREKLLFTRFVLAETWWQFGPAGALLAVAGFWRAWRTLPRHIAASLLLGFLGHTLVLIALLSFDYDLRYRNVFRVYPLVAYGVCAVWLGAGLQWITDSLVERLRERARPALLRWSMAAVVAGSLLIANAPSGYRANDNWADDYGRALLETLPAGARFFVLGDYATGPVGYLNLVQGVRPDVKLYNAKGLLFDTRLHDPIGTTQQEQAAAIDAFITSTTEPVLYTFVLPHAHALTDYGLYYGVDESRPRGSRTIVLLPAVRAYLENTLDRGVPADPGRLVHYRQLTAQYCATVADLVERAAAPLDELRAALDARCENFQGLLQRARAVLDGPDRDPARAREFLGRAVRHAHEAVTIDNRAELDRLLDRARQTERSANGAMTSSEAAGNE